MQFIDKEFVAQYQDDDWILSDLIKISRTADRDYTSQRWLRDSLLKRATFAAIYRDVLKEKTGLRIVDIGGSLSSFTRVLSDRHDYTLVDFLAHESISDASLKEEFPLAKIRRRDWFEDQAEMKNIDLVIANDLFPNVDQRLQLFLGAFIPISKEIRFTATWHNEPKAYAVKRIDADEVLTILSWDHQRLLDAVKRFRHLIPGFCEDKFTKMKESIWENGRHVCVLEVDCHQQQQMDTVLSQST